METSDSLGVPLPRTSSSGCTTGPGAAQVPVWIWESWSTSLFVTLSGAVSVNDTLVFPPPRSVSETLPLYPEPFTSATGKVCAIPAPLAW